METQIKLGIIAGIFAVLAAITQIILPTIIDTKDTIDSSHPVVVNVTPVVTYKGIEDETLAVAMQNTNSIKKLIFEDYFKDEDSGWKTYPNDDDCERYYDDGMFNFDIKSDVEDHNYNSLLEDFTLPRNFIVEFDAIVKRDLQDQRVGIFIRRIDHDNKYYFCITSDGDYSFKKYVNGDIKRLIPWKNSFMINKGIATNNIKIKCEEDKFTFYINNEEVDSYTDTTFPKGGVALVAGNGDDTSRKRKLAFDNLKIWLLDINEI